MHVKALPDKPCRYPHVCPEDVAWAWFMTVDAVRGQIEPHRVYK